MKLSIVIPVYNIAAYLPRCVKSLLIQDLKDCEILLVDDGSTDGESGQLCDRFAADYPDLIRAIHKPNGGPGDARNVGLEEATGEYILFIDSDDYVSPDMVHTLWPYMDKGIDVIIFGYLVDTEGVVSRPPEDRLPLEQVTDLSHFPELLLAAPSAWNKLWHRSLFLEKGIRYPKRIWYEDLATTGTLLAVAESITAIDAELYYYVAREGSITRNTDTARNLEIIDAMERLRNWFALNAAGKYKTELEAVAAKHVLLTTSIRALRSGDWETVLTELQNYMNRMFPTWADNPQVQQFPLRYRLLLALLRWRRFRLVRMLFIIKDRRR